MSTAQAESSKDATILTPPYSPPISEIESKMDEAGDGPPALADIISHSLSLSPVVEREHVRTATPSTPDRADALPFVRGGSGAARPCSTPDRGSPGGSTGSDRRELLGGNVPGAFGGHHGAHISELTPVISNSGSFVDARLASGPTRPGIPGLAEPGAPIRGGRPGIDGSFSSSSGDGVLSASARGLRQRRLPLPRAGPPPAKRIGIEGSGHVEGGRGGTATATEATANVPSRASSLLSSEESCDGLAHLLGERLSMPSYSDDGSSVDTSERNARVRSERGTAVLGADRSIFQRGGGPSLAAPIELGPERRFFSFQGAGQYKQRVVANCMETPSKILETIPSPSRRPPASPKKDWAAVTKEQRQYQPSLRSQHGVQEMADAQDLNAIFKAPRKKDAAVVTPFVSPSMEDSRLQPMLSPAAEEGDPFEHPHPLANPYHMESEWSIPSIRLANHVNQTSSSDRHPMDSFASYADFSECTEDDESFYSFLDDDDDADASLSSRGSLDASARRRRRISGVFQLRRKASEGASPAVPAGRSADAASGNDAVVALPPALSRRANTFDSGVPPPIFSVVTTPSTADDAADEYRRPRRHHNRGGRRRRREGAAAEWLRELQDRSRDAASGIAEAASSRFLDGRRDATGKGDEARALGMPHPLCRSSTIEPGPFVGAGVADVVVLGGGNSIALTSSGSGD